MTLKEIREFMLTQLPKSNIKEFAEMDNDSHYDYDGHCSRNAYLKIINFWENFDNDKDFLYLITGECEYNLDLSGGRSYLLPEEELAPMCLEYLVNNLGWTYEKFDESICNSTELNEYIDRLYHDKSYIRDIKLKNFATEPAVKPIINIWSGYDFEKFDNPEKNTFIGWMKKFDKPVKNTFIDWIKKLGK